MYIKAKEKVKLNEKGEIEKNFYLDSTYIIKIIQTSFSPYTDSNQYKYIFMLLAKTFLESYNIT
jgi:hypothetical protein